MAWKKIGSSPERWGFPSGDGYARTRLANHDPVRGATVIIAASNAREQTMEDADLVCDGTADDDDIALALEMLRDAGGGDILLSEGQFNIASRINVDQSNVAIRGRGIRATTLKAASGLNDNLMRIAAASGTLNGFMLERLTVDGNGANQSDGASVEERSAVYFKGSDGAGLSDAVFRDLYVTLARGMGMSLDGVSSAKLTRALLQNVKALGNGDDTYGFASDGVHVAYGDDLTVEGYNAQLNTDTGLAMDYCTGVSISDILCRANEGNNLAIARQSKHVKVVNALLDGLDAGLGTTAYGLRTGKFGDGAAAVTQDLMLQNVQVIRNAVGLKIDDHAILQANGLYCPGSGGDGNTTPLETSGSSFMVFGSGGVGISVATGGASSIASGQTSVVVNHNLNAALAAAIPIALRHIQITPNEQSTTGRLFAVTAVTSTTFTVTLSGDPGASGWDFSWQARIDV